MSPGDLDAPDAPEETLSEPAPISAPWPLLHRLPALLAAQPGSRENYRELLKQGHEELKARFLAEDSIEVLVHARALLVDVVLRQVWRELGSEESRWSLVAVGGYGRGELHPCS